MATSQQGVAPGRHHARVIRFLSRKPLTAGRAARIIASVTVTVTVVSGVLIHWIDETNFPDIGTGMWWAVQTVTTVGYGDVVPKTTSGQLVATLVMVFGIGFLTVMTAAITSAFVEAARRRIGGAEADQLSSQLDRIGSRLEAIEATLADTGARGPGAR